jgi:hypothetical protein
MDALKNPKLIVTILWQNAHSANSAYASVASLDFWVFRSNLMKQEGIIPANRNKYVEIQKRSSTYLP